MIMDNRPTVSDFSNLICDFFEAVRQDKTLTARMRDNPAVNEACVAMLNALERMHFLDPGAVERVSDLVTPENI